MCKLSASITAPSNLTTTLPSAVTIRLCSSYSWRSAITSTTLPFPAGIFSTCGSWGDGGNSTVVGVDSRFSGFLSLNSIIFWTGVAGFLSPTDRSNFPPDSCKFTLPDSVGGIGVAAKTTDLSRNN